MFEEQVRAIATKVKNQRDVIKTEEATKNAFVMPFISTVLGYDVFDPSEVVPEFTADVGTKRGEKVDYAIIHNGEVQILIECKQLSDPLRIEHASQLYRYFSVTNARIAILTNGQVYNFYTDLDAPNKMDDKPFLVLDLENIDEYLLPELRKLTKEVFDLDSVISLAEELKYVGQIKRMIEVQFKAPEDELVRFFTNRLYEGSFTQKRRDQFRLLVVKAAAQFVEDQVNNRLKTALYTSPTEVPSQEINEEFVEEQEVTMINGIQRVPGAETSDEEIKAYELVKEIVGEVVNLGRVVGRDSKTYFTVLIDGNKRKPVARFHFNGKAKKYLGTFDDDKVETRHQLNNVTDIVMYINTIRSSARLYQD